MKDTVVTPSETDRLFVDLDQPSLHGLSYALRHPETWRGGFVWDYRDCDTCAIGLACALWDGIAKDWRIGLRAAKRSSEIMAECFSIDAYVALDIFIRAAPRHKTIRAFVTPFMVADDIDAFLARREAA